MPRETNFYKIQCKRCDKQFDGKMATQKYCTTCSHIVNRLRRSGLEGDWTNEKEKKVLKTHTRIDI